MTRGKFFKGLAALLVAPKAIIEIAKNIPEEKSLYIAANTFGNEAKYIAGYVKFSEQLLRNLPYLQETLPSIIMRDFLRKENSGEFDFIKFGNYISIHPDPVKLRQVL